MAKKKKKRGKNGGLLDGLAELIGTGIRCGFKVLPFLIIVATSGAIFLSVRKALYADSYLSVQKITVHPPDAFSTERRARLDSSLLGKNILKVNIREVSDSLEKDPFVLKARILKKLPSELVVEVQKRQPFGFARFSPKGNFVLLSEDGMVLETVPEKSVTGLILEAFMVNIADPGMGKKVRVPGLPETVEFVKAFQDSLVARYETLTKLSLDHLGNLTIRLGQGPDVRLGRSPQQKMAALEKVLPLLQGNGREKIDYIDLIFENVIVKQKKGAK